MIKCVRRGENGQKEYSKSENGGVEKIQSAICLLAQFPASAFTELGSQLC